MNRKRSNSDPQNFNPYHQWLGIPEKNCPPTHYELLGISLDEDDLGVINSAAERQKSHIEQFLGTEFNKYANKLISQIDEAEIVLTSPELRREYDRKVNLFKKRRKKRQIDPNIAPSPFSSNGTRSVGEDSGFFGEYAGIVAVLSIAFFGMAAASFWLPWGKLETDKQNANKNIAKQEEPIAEPRGKILVGKNESNMTAVIPTETPDPVNSIGMQFKKIKPGTFMMGSEVEDVKTRPVHEVTISKPFEISIYEVTQKQYQSVMGANPSQFKEPQKPVENICWNDAVEFCSKLSNMNDGKSGKYLYRLPTEAEWEYACRAGTTTKYYFGDNDSHLVDYGFCNENANANTHPVGTKKPNPWGLYDMHGNVAELCQDWFAKYSSQMVIDQTGPESRKFRILRGGSWFHIPIYCSSAIRNNCGPDYRANFIGFRVVRVPSQQATGGGNGL